MAEILELLPESYERSTTRAGTKCPPPCRIGLWMSGSTPNSNLIILLKDHCVSALYILHIHLMFNHATVPHTMFRMNQPCHVIGFRQYIKKVLLCCTFREPIKLFERMSTLPPINYLDPSKHHYYVQIDYRKSSIRSRLCIILDSDFPRLLMELDL